MDRRYSKRYRQTFLSVCSRHFKPSDSFTYGAKKDFKTNSSTLYISLEEEIPSKMEGANKKKSNQMDKGHRKGNYER